MLTKNTGYTLVEISAVITIMGILLCAITLTTRSVAFMTLKTDMNAVKDDINFARKIAINEGATTAIAFDTVNNTYTVKKGTSAFAGYLKTVRLTSSIDNINTTLNTISITPRGTTGSACTIRMSVIGHRGEMTVNVGSGRVKITYLK